MASGPPQRGPCHFLTLRETTLGRASLVLIVPFVLFPPSLLSVRVPHVQVPGPPLEGPSMAYTGREGLEPSKFLRGRGLRPRPRSSEDQQRSQAMRREIERDLDALGKKLESSQSSQRGEAKKGNLSRSRPKSERCLHLHEVGSRALAMPSRRNNVSQGQGTP